jgi:hypothetical protein
MSPGEQMKGTAGAHRVLVWRAVGVLCVLTMVVLGVLAGKHYLAPSESSAVDPSAGQNDLTSKATGETAAAASADAGGASSPCDSCDARHRHILRLREESP